MEVKLPRRLFNERGFSLVEISIALVIGAVGLLALAGILGYVMTTNRFATDISIATALARQKMEQIKLTDYNYVQDEAEYNLDENGNQVTGGKFTRITEVTENQPAFNTKTVTVTVYFSPSMQDTLKKAVISTIIYP